MNFIKRWTVLLLMFVTVYVMSACGSFSANAADIPEVTVTTTSAQVQGADLSAVLSVSDTPFDSESVELTFTLTNNADTPLYVLRWFTPLEGILNNIFNVTRDNISVDYEGPMVMRGDPQPEEYILLAAGESASNEVNLAKVYDFSVAGDYTIEFNSPVFTHVAESKEDMAETVDDLQSIAIPSNPVTVTITSPNRATEPVPEPEDTELKHERYNNTDFGFTFQYPNTWTLNQESEQLVTLAKGKLRLSIAYSREGGREEPWWTGLPAGDLHREKAISFMGESMEKLKLIYKGKVTTLIYDCKVMDIVFVIRLDDAVTSDYDAIDISDVDQQDVDEILSSFTTLASTTNQALMHVEGTVQNASPSARTITLSETVDGIQIIALKEACELTWDDGSTVALNEIRPGMSVKVTGEIGSSSTLLASEIQVTTEE